MKKIRPLSMAGRSAGAGGGLGGAAGAVRDGPFHAGAGAAAPAPAQTIRTEGREAPPSRRSPTPRAAGGPGGRGHAGGPEPPGSRTRSRLRRNPMPRSSRRIPQTIRRQPEQPGDDPQPGDHPGKGDNDGPGPVDRSPVPPTIPAPASSRISATVRSPITS